MATVASRSSSPAMGQTTEMLLMVGWGKVTVPATVSLAGTIRSSSVRRVGRMNDVDMTAPVRTEATRDPGGSLQRADGNRLRSEGWLPRIGRGASRRKQVYLEGRSETGR